MQVLKSLLPTLVLFACLDYLWIGVLGKSLYLENLGSLLLVNGQTMTPRLLPAAVVYVLFAVMIWFIVLPLAKRPYAFLFVSLHQNQ